MALAASSLVQPLDKVREGEREGKDEEREGWREGGMEGGGVRMEG